MQISLMLPVSSLSFLFFFIFLFLQPILHSSCVNMSFVLNNLGLSFFSPICPSFLLSLSTLTTFEIGYTLVIFISDLVSLNVFPFFINSQCQAPKVCLGMHPQKKMNENSFVFKLKMLSSLTHGIQQTSEYD
jgi:hypothetical protein